MLEVLLWLVGRDSEQGVLLHVCSKALQRRLFGMTWLEVGARRARRAVGGAWCDSATMCYSEPSYEFASENIKANAAERWNGLATDAVRFGEVGYGDVAATGAFLRGSIRCNSFSSQAGLGGWR